MYNINNNYYYNILFLVLSFNFSLFFAHLFLYMYYGKTTIEICFDMIVIASDFEIESSLIISLTKYD